MTIVTFRQHQLWRAFISAALLFIVVVLQAVFPGKTDQSKEIYIVVFCCIGIATSTISLLVSRYITDRNWSPYFWGTSVLDITAVLILILLTGGLGSEFWILYALASLTLLTNSPEKYSRPIVPVISVLPLAVGLLQWFDPNSNILHSVENLQKLSTRAAYQASFLLLIGLITVRVASRTKETQAQLAEKETNYEYLEILSDVIIDTIPSGIVLFDNNTKILQINQSAVDLLHSNVSKFIESCIEKNNESGRLEIEFLIDKSIRRFGFSLTDVLLPTKANEVRAKVLVFQDLTSIRNLENKIQREEKLSALGRMGANLAHEIRNPLASISNALQLLQRDDQRENYTPLITLATSEVTRLQTLLDQFIDMVRMQDGLSKATVLQSVDPLEIVKNVVAILPKSGCIDIQNENNSLISCDPDYLYQVIYNLLLNATQWAAKDNPVVECQIGSITDPSILIKIADNGPGIPEDQIDTIWEPFVTTRNGGTGLGLSLVSTLISQIGCEIHANKHDSKLGGASFVIRYNA